MPEALAIETIPLIAGDDGVIRVEGTRVLLETIVAAFQEGGTAEEISQQYPSVPLGVVYQVVGYYLRHRDELDGYLASRVAAHAAAKALNESRWPSSGIRARLLARGKK